MYPFDKDAVDYSTKVDILNAKLEDTNSFKSISNHILKLSKKFKTQDHNGYCLSFLEMFSPVELLVKFQETFNKITTNWAENDRAFDSFAMWKKAEDFISEQVVGSTRCS